jgi:hypothetical protein
MYRFERARLDVWPGVGMGAADYEVIQKSELEAQKAKLPADARRA